MATKRYRKSNKSKELTYEDIKGLDFSTMSSEDLEKYGFGSWLKDNDTENTPQTTQFQGDSKNLLNNTSQTSGAGKSFSSVPIIGAFASLGTSIGGAFTQRDEYGIAQASEGAQAVGNFIDPITVSQDLAKEGKYGQAALSALIPGAGSIFGARLNKRKKRRLEEERSKQLRFDAAQREFSQLEDTPIYGGVMRNGGTLNYGGQLHEGPDGGVPVDNSGNYNPVNPVAMVEKGEVSYTGEDGNPYIFSDTLQLSKGKTFAKEAKGVQSKYRLRMKNGKVTDSIAKKGYDLDMEGLKSKQEELRDVMGLMEDSEMAKNREYGGNLPMYWAGGTGLEDEPKGSYAWAASENPNIVTPQTSTAYEDLNAMLDADINSFKRTLELWNKYPKIANWKAPKVGPGSIQRMKKALGITTNNSNVNSSELYRGMNWDGSKLPPLVKPISDTAAMDEFDNQVEMDYLKMQQDVGNLAKKSNPQLYQGMNWAETGLAAAAPVLGGITGLILNSRRKAPANLKLSRMTPQQISLERRRAAARESAGVATSNLTRSLRNAAPTAGSYMSNVVAGITDIDRNLSNALGESYTQEEIQNAQLRQQADAANLDIDMQEQMYNSQLQNQFGASKKAASNAYLSQIGQGVTSALNQKFQSSRDADYLNMKNPDYAMAVTGKGLRRRKMILPRTQIGG